MKRRRSSSTTTPIPSGAMSRAADATSYSNRNPKSWKIYGGNSAGANASWTLIDERTNVNINSLWTDFTVTSNTTAYQYYRFEVTSVLNDEEETNHNRRWKCQVSELQLFGHTSQEYVRDLTNGSITGLQSTYNYTGSNISVSYTVKDAANATVSSSNYQATISPSTVKDPGLYTLTITGKGNYSGTKTATFRVVKALSGNGTAESPYLINNMIEWLAFADYISGDNAHYGDKKYKLCADLSGVTTMVGTSANPFKGEFNGDGHTLNLNLSADAQYCAPFRYVDEATIRNVHTTGTVTAGSATENNRNKYRAGLIGNAKSGTKIYNCWSSVTINSSLTGDGTHGGFIGIVDGSVEFHDCLFDGTISGSTTTRCGGFVGWKDGTLNIENSLYAPATIPEGKYQISTSNSATFARNGANITKGYYTERFDDGVHSSYQGTSTNGATGSGLQALLGNGWQVKDNKVVPVMVMNANYVNTITEPTFKNVTFKSSTSDSRTIVKADGKVKFIGYYDAFDVTPQDEDIYYMTPGNMLRPTAVTCTLKACRAYFQFSDNGMKAREFILNFGDEETTAIDEMRNENVEMRNDAWYTVDGVKLSGKPTRKGIYIFNGKKTVIR